MKCSKKILLSGLVALSFIPAIASAQSLAGYSNLTSFSVLSGSYVTTGAGSNVSGDMGALTYIATGANSSGASSNYAGSYITTGAGSTGSGSNFAGGYITPGLGSTVIGSNTAGLAPASFTNVNNALLELSAAQLALKSLTAGSTLAATMDGKQTMTAGVYNAPALTTAAGTVLTLDAAGQTNPYWVFNIDTYLSTGASTSVNIANLGLGGTASVIWNTGGYASFGESNSFVGSVFAGEYISTGATTTSGPLFAKEYVTLGASGTINSMVVAPIPEPEIYALMLAGIGLLTLKVRREKKNQLSKVAA
ncbi:MAG: ice-binding family protein [Polaromonas sp.]|nr:ice-binding family protein [Polaromonas sp.]